MDVIKAISRRSLWTLVLLMLLLGIILSLGAYGGLTLGAEKMSALVQTYPELSDLTDLNQKITDLKTNFWFTVLPAVAALHLMAGLLAWLIIRGGLRKVTVPSRTPQRSARPAKIDAKEKSLNDQRLFVHLFAVLQREGRLMDFLAENLDPYEDGQIGSAVRSIHNSCRDLIQKYLAPRPIIDQEEGQQITVPPDFDPAAVKLTGNVTGNPPFQGVLRHRGWQAGKLNLPTLSSAQNAAIIAPAEVEIT